MLTEHECRVLRTAAEVFVKDFDAKDAACFMEIRGVFSEDEAKRIESQVSSLERLREFLRIYTRRADGMGSLIAYFEHSRQPDLETFVRNALEHHNDNPRQLDGEKFHMRQEERRRRLANGMVPSTRNLVKRTRMVEKIRERLKHAEPLDSFFVVLHGMAGVGKTALAAAVLSDTDLLGTSFDHVCFVTDSRLDPSKVNFLFCDLLTMLLDDPHLYYRMDLSTTALKKMVVDALHDRPNTLVVFDNVTQPETVLWAQQLRLRVLATTRNSCLFNKASSAVDFIDVNGFEFHETKELLMREGIKISDGNIKPNRAVEFAHEMTSGNPAFLMKMAKMAAGRPDKMIALALKLSKSGVSPIKIISSYDYESMHDSFSFSVKQLTDEEQMALACAGVMPAGHWVPLEVWALVVPVDVCETGEVIEEVFTVLRALRNNGGWLQESEDHEAFKVPVVVSSYLKETVGINALRECYQRLETAISNALATTNNANFYNEGQSQLRDYFHANSSLYGLSLPGTAV